MPLIDDIIDPSSEVTVVDGIIPARRIPPIPRARVVRLTPVGGVIRTYGELLSFQMAPVAIPTSAPIDKVTWTVKAYAQSRGVGEHTFSWEGETPYREYELTGPLGSTDTFNVAAEDSRRGWSTWVVTVQMWSDSRLVGTGTAVFAVLVDIGAVSGVMLPAVAPCMAAPMASVVLVSVVSNATVAIAAPRLRVSRSADPGIVLDPSQVS